jgi:hypothetical protein
MALGCSASLSYDPQAYYHRPICGISNWSGGSFGSYYADAATTSTSVSFTEEETRHEKLLNAIEELSRLIPQEESHKRIMRKIEVLSYYISE